MIKNPTNWLGYIISIHGSIISIPIKIHERSKFGSVFCGVHVSLLDAHSCEDAEVGDLSSEGTSWWFQPFPGLKNMKYGESRIQIIETQYPLVICYIAIVFMVHL
jgi:hypothetical protein